MGRERRRRRGRKRRARRERQGGGVLRDFRHRVIRAFAALAVTRWVRHCGIPRRGVCFDGAVRGGVPIRRARRFRKRSAEIWRAGRVRLDARPR